MFCYILINATEIYICHTRKVILSTANTVETSSLRSLFFCFYFLCLNNRKGTWDVSKKEAPHPN